MFIPQAILPRNGKVGIDGATRFCGGIAGSRWIQCLHLSTRTNSRYVGLTDPVFRWLERGDQAAVTSAITMTELLVPAYRLRTPDALQPATAVHARATGLITSDPVFERVEGFEALVLEGAVSARPS